MIVYIEIRPEALKISGSALYYAIFLIMLISNSLHRAVLLLPSQAAFLFP